MENELAYKLEVAESLREGLRVIKGIYKQLWKDNPLAEQWQYLQLKEHYGMEWESRTRESNHVHNSRKLWAKLHHQGD